MGASTSMSNPLMTDEPKGAKGRLATEAVDGPKILQRFAAAAVASAGVDQPPSEKVAPPSERSTDLLYVAWHSLMSDLFTSYQC